MIKPLPKMWCCQIHASMIFEGGSFCLIRKILPSCHWLFDLKIVILGCDLTHATTSSRNTRAQWQKHTIQSTHMTSLTHSKWSMWSVGDITRRCLTKSSLWSPASRISDLFNLRGATFFVLQSRFLDSIQIARHKE